MQLTFRQKKQERLFRVAIFSALIVILLPVIFLSLGWRLQHDAPLMFYAAFLMDKFKAVPYVDFFDMNTPATYIVYWGLGKIFSYSDLPLRIADLLILGGILGATWSFQRQFNRVVAWFSVLMFALIYIAGGPHTSLQRDSIVLLLTVWALWLVIRPSTWSIFWRGLLIGVLFGTVFAIRPPFALVIPPIVFYFFISAWEKISRNQKVYLACTLGVGFLIPVVAIGVYLWQSGAWSAFWDMVRNYWPLYANINFDLGAVEGSNRIIYLLNNTLEAGKNPGLLVASGLVALAVLFGTRIPRSDGNRVLLLICLFVICLSYPAITNNFWPYHWFPFNYMATLIVSLAFIDHTWWKSLQAARIALVGLGTAVFIGGVANVVVQTQVFINPSEAIPEFGSADMLSAYLQTHLHSGETVQGLSLTGGVIHALLMNQIKLATPYMYDFYFYHHVNTPYIQGLRRDFIEKLQAAKPQFIIKETYLAYIRVPRDLGSFPELDRFLNENYKVVEQVDLHYIIYERQQN